MKKKKHEIFWVIIRDDVGVMPSTMRITKREAIMAVCQNYAYSWEQLKQRIGMDCKKVYVEIL